MSRFFENKKTRAVLSVLGIILLFNGILAAILESLSLGVILTLAFGVCLLLCAALKNTKAIIAVKVVILLLLTMVMLYGIIIYAYGGNDNVTYKEDAVIVLGTVVIGDEPSTDLKNRLDATIEYHQENPEALIIVTGGQGTDENDSEASVMAKYLLKAGIPQNKVIMENRATSTAENFKYSAEILDTELGAHIDIAYISNDFHIFRAGILAENARFEDATHYHGKTPWFMIIPNGLRESIVTLKMWLID